MNYELGVMRDEVPLVSGHLRVMSYEFRVKAFVSILNVDLIIGFLLLACSLRLVACSL